MRGAVVIDTNLMVLLIVGSASREYIPKHKHLSGYTVDDFDMLGLLLSEFSDIVLLPHIVSEVSSLSRQIDEPARTKIQSALRTLIETCAEIPVPSITGAGVRSLLNSELPMRPYFIFARWMSMELLQH